MISSVKEILAESKGQRKELETKVRDSPSQYPLRPPSFCGSQQGGNPITSPILEAPGKTEVHGMNQPHTRRKLLTEYSTSNWGEVFVTVRRAHEFYRHNPTPFIALKGVHSE